jgi:hypothetical protein
VIFNSTVTSETLSDLAGNTTYTFTVAAITANGPGAASDQSSPITLGTPPAATPEAPTPLLFPAAAILAGVGVLLVRRRRRPQVSA